MFFQRRVIIYTFVKVDEIKNDTSFVLCTRTYPNPADPNLLDPCSLSN